MSSAKTHAIRSHRSKSGYKPINKSMCHAAAKRRKSVRKFINIASRGKDAFDRLLPRFN